MTTTQKEKVSVSPTPYDSDDMIRIKAKAEMLGMTLEEFKIEACLLWCDADEAGSMYYKSEQESRKPLTRFIE